MTKPLELFLFDLAGTTVCDDGYVQEAIRRTAEQWELAVDESRLRSFMGWHKKLVFATCLQEAGRDPEPAQEMARSFEDHYAGIVRERGLLPTRGAVDALAALQSQGIGVAFTTGFSRKTADMVLAVLGWSGYASVASTEVERGRPAPDLIHLAMRRMECTDAARVGTAGDTPADLEAGSAAGCRMVVGVGCGTHTLQQLQGSPHTHLLEDLRDLPALVHGM